MHQNNIFTRQFGSKPRIQNTLQRNQYVEPVQNQYEPQRQTFEFRPSSNASSGQRSHQPSYNASPQTYSNDEYEPGAQLRPYGSNNPVYVDDDSSDSDTESVSDNFEELNQQGKDDDTVEDESDQDESDDEYQMPVQSRRAMPSAPINDPRLYSKNIPTSLRLDVDSVSDDEEIEYQRNKQKEFVVQREIVKRQIDRENFRSNNY